MLVSKRFNQTIPQLLRKFFLVYLGQLRYVERNILNPRYQSLLNQHKNHFPLFDAKAATILEDLERTGIHITSMEALGLPNLSSFLEAARILGQELEQVALRATQGQTSITATASQLVRYQDVYLWGLNNYILAIAERFLKLPVAYGFPSFRLHIAKSGKENAGHWHKDIEDRSLIKIAVYFNDITEDASPFEYWDLESSARLIEIIKNKHPFRGVYKTLSHQALSKLVPSDLLGRYKTCLGAKGTVLFIDTGRLLHRQKPISKVERLSIFYSYYSRRPSHPFFCGPGHFSRNDLNFLTKNLSQYQKDCVFWRDELNNLQLYLLKL